MSWIYFFDIFSRKPRLKINGNSRLSSKLVSILGIILLVGYIGISLYLTSRVVYKETFNIIENTKTKDYNNFKLDNENPLSFAVTNNQGIEIKDYERVFDMKLIYFEFTTNLKNRTSTTKATNIKRSQCTYKKLPGDNIEIFEDLYKLYNNSIHCFDLKPFNVSIFGEDSPGVPHGFLVFYLNQCKNTTTNNNCLPQRELDIILGEIKVSFAFSNFDTDNSLSNPFTKYTEGKFLRFSNSLKTRYTYEIDKLEFLSDEGLIFDHIVRYESYQIKQPSIMQNLALGTILFPGTIGNINIFGSGRKTTYQRSYIKFHTILPYLIGIYQITILLFKLLVNYLGGGELDEYLFSNLIEKEEYDKFSAINKIITYDELFKKKQNEERNNLNFISDLNLDNKVNHDESIIKSNQNLDLQKNCERENYKPEKISTESINCQQEMKEFEPEKNSHSSENVNNGLLRNNYFSKENVVKRERDSKKKKNTKEIKSF